MINGVPCGTGTLYYTNGDTYKGMFKDSKFHGHGTYRYADGQVYIGDWENNYKTHGVEIKLDST